VPTGRANLIRASHQAGMKPVTIARTLRISRSLVDRVLGGMDSIPTASTAVGVLYAASAS
jgi:hypothetical protein